MEVRYGDAKHHTLRKNALTSQQRDGLAAASCKGVTPYDADHLASLQNKLRSQQGEVVAKAKMVHAGLKEGLGKLSLSLDAFKKKHVLLFTNVPTDAIELDGSVESPRKALAAVSPDTFRWSSWTPFVYLDGASTANAQSGRKKAHQRNDSHSKSRPSRR